MHELDYIVSGPSFRNLGSPSHLRSSTFVKQHLPGERASIKYNGSSTSIACTERQLS